MQTVPALPRVLPWNSAPEDMAARLRVLPGLVWLDTAGHRPEPDSDGGLSLLTASPREILTGHLSDPAPLERALAELRQRASSQADWGFPTSGLFGTVDYDGHYTFGVYDEVLIYRHATREWFGTGPELPGFLTQLNPSAPPPPAAQNPPFARGSRPTPPRNTINPS